jgi:hypothetical protein
VEAYAAVHRGPDTYFATGADFRSESEGTVLLGLAARGDLAFTTADSSLGAGWRRVRGARTTHVELDWRRNRLTTADQGYAGLLPGLLSDLYTVRADARASTLSLRGGCERELTRRLRLLSGLSVHRSVLDGNWRLRRVRGLGRDPETVSEHHLSNGVLAMVGLSLGLAYQDSHWRCVLTGTGAYGAINSALKNLFRHEPSPTPGGPSRRFRPQPIVALTAEYRF